MGTAKRSKEMKGDSSGELRWGLVLVLAVILVYQPVWLAGFSWDDDSIVTENPVIIGPLGLTEIWTTSAADICPLTLTTFWLEHALWGLAPLPYHLVTVLMHAGSALLLWRVLRDLCVPGAWLGAALWALHPVEVESVAWIGEMKNTQSGLFFLLAILFFLRFLRANEAKHRRESRWSYGWSLLFAALAMASKSSTVVLPIVLGLCAWWVEGRWRWRNLTRLAPIALISVVPVALTIWTQKLRSQGAESLQWARTLPERLITAGDAVWFYLGKLLWPHPLILIYPRWEADPASWLSYLPLVAVVVALVYLWWNRGTWSRPYFFAFAGFVIVLLPVLGLVDGFFWRYSLVADHFQYLASMGPLALAGAGLAGAADRVLPGRAEMQSRLAAGLLLILGMISWQRVWMFQNLETIWTDTVAQNPGSWMAHNNLGDVFYHQDKIDEAMAEYQKALAINPNEVNSLSNLGILLAEKGRNDEAIAHFQKALALRPNFGRALNNLGVVLYQTGQIDAAMAEFQKTLEIDPYFPQIHYNIGNILLQKGQLDEARDQYQQALQIDPGNFEAMVKLGSVLLKQGRIDEAIAQLQRALQLQPDDSDAQRNLTQAQAAATYKK